MTLTMVMFMMATSLMETVYPFWLTTELRPRDRSLLRAVLATCIWIGFLAGVLCLAVLPH
jgi:hypothetical protein